MFVWSTLSMKLPDTVQMSVGSFFWISFAWGIFFHSSNWLVDLSPLHSFQILSFVESSLSIKIPDTVQMSSESLSVFVFVCWLFLNFKIRSFAIVSLFQLIIGSFLSLFIPMFKLISESFLACSMFVWSVMIWFWKIKHEPPDKTAMNLKPTLIQYFGILLLADLFKPGNSFLVVNGKGLWFRLATSDTANITSQTREGECIRLDTTTQIVQVSFLQKYLTLTWV